MDWQQIIALGIVAGTAAIFIWSRLRARAKCGCLSQCGDCGHSQPPPSPGASITYHSRKGERPTITVRE